MLFVYVFDSVYFSFFYSCVLFEEGIRKRLVGWEKEIVGARKGRRNGV